MLDIGMSTVASGILAKFALEGRQLPDGWVVARQDGSPITDPVRVSEGMLTPMGGHKGLGLAFMIGLLAGALNGAAFGKDLPDFAAGGGFGVNSGQFLIALDVSGFMSLPDFRSRITTSLTEMGILSPGEETDFKVRLPGVDRARRQADQLKNGLSYSPQLLSRLNRLAQELSVGPIHRDADGV
ncbi:Ldh family oxidoreductase [Paraburkholderia strydomiana]